MAGKKKRAGDSVFEDLSTFVLVVWHWGWGTESRNWESALERGLVLTVWAVLASLAIGGEEVLVCLALMPVAGAALFVSLQALRALAGVIWVSRLMLRRRRTDNDLWCLGWRRLLVYLWLRWWKKSDLRHDGTGILDE